MHAQNHSIEGGGLISTDEAAAIFGLQPDTLKKWRRRGTGPAFLRLGRSIRYDRADVKAFTAQQRVEPRGAV